MFSPLQDSNEFRPALAPRKKKFHKPSDASAEKLPAITLDTMLLLDYWAYVVPCIPAPSFAYAKSWLYRCGNDVDLCLRAIDYVARRNPLSFDGSTHAHRACATAINRQLEKREGLAA